MTFMILWKKNSCFFTFSTGFFFFFFVLRLEKNVHFDPHHVEHLPQESGMLKSEHLLEQKQIIIVKRFTQKFENNIVSCIFIAVNCEVTLSHKS